MGSIVIYKFSSTFFFFFLFLFSKIQEIKKALCLKEHKKRNPSFGSLEYFSLVWFAELQNSNCFKMDLLSFALKMSLRRTWCARIFGCGFFLLLLNKGRIKGA